MDDFLDRQILKGLLVGSLGLPLMLGDNNILLAFADFLIGVFFGLVEHTELLSILKNDLGLLTLLTVDQLLQVGQLLSKLSVFISES